MEMAGFEPVKACSTSSNCDLNSDTFLYILAIAKLAHGEGRLTDEFTCIEQNDPTSTDMSLSTSHYPGTDFSRISFSFLVFVVVVDARVIQLGSPLLRMARTRS